MGSCCCKEDGAILDSEVFGDEYAGLSSSTPYMAYESNIPPKSEYANYGEK